MKPRPESVTHEMERLVDQKREYMANYAKNRGVFPEDQVEDCVGVAIVRFFAGFDHELGFKPITYLYSVMNSVILEWKRDARSISRHGKSRPRMVSIDAVPDRYVDAYPSAQFDPYRDVDSADSARLKIERLKKRISVRGRRVLQGMLEGETAKETGKVLGVSEHCIHQHRTKIREIALECGVRS